MIVADLRDVQVWVATTPVDMRKSFDGLAEVVRSFLGHDPLSGSLFVFRNKGGHPREDLVVGPGRVDDLLQAAGARRVSIPALGQARGGDQLRAASAAALRHGYFNASGRVNSSCDSHNTHGTTGFMTVVTEGTAERCRCLEADDR